MARLGLITLTEKRLSPPPADLFLLECIGRNIMKNDYYVYGHYFCENHVLFYIGKGRRDRLNKVGGRSKQWSAITSNSEWYADIIKDNLTSDEALYLETELIKSQQGLVNVKVKTSTNTLSEEYLSNFYYDESSPSCLKWAKDIVGINGRIYQRCGDNAGCARSGNDRSTKRWQVAKDGKVVYGHRIVYALFHKLDTRLVIDHIDGDSLNNRISNLRQVPQDLNTRNIKIRKLNSTGVTGITRRKRKHLSFYQYDAVCALADGTQLRKEFSTYKRSEEEAFRLACEWRIEQIAELNKQGAGYTERHGT